MDETATVQQEDLFEAEDLFVPEEPEEGQEDGEEVMEKTEPQEDPEGEEQAQAAPPAGDAPTEAEEAPAVQETPVALTAQEEPLELAVLDRYAAANGMTRAEFVAQLDRQFQQTQLEQEQARVWQQYPGAAPELVAQVAQANLRRREEEQQRLAEERRLEEQRRQEEPWAAFFAQVPDVATDAIPPEVFQRVAEGLTPLAAWYEHQNRALQRQLDAAKQNEHNRQSSLGSVRDTAAPGGKDPFLEAFEGVFTE